MTVRVEADKSRCIGAAACLGSTVLDLDDNGKIEVVGDGVVPNEEVADLEDSVGFCPVTALRLVQT